MKKVIASLFIVASMTAVSGAALAADAGMYAGLKVGQANYDYTNLTKNNPTVGGIFGGYSFNQNVAVEAEYVDLGSFGSATTAGSATTWGASVVGSLPVGDSFSLSAKLGFASTTTKAATAGTAASATTSDVTYGLGAQYDINQSVGVRLGYDRYKVGGGAIAKGNVNLYSIAGVFKF